MTFYGDYQTRPPGLILGQFEGLLAIIAWVNEALRETEYKFGPTQSLVISPKMKEQLLAAYLIYGNFDAFASIRLFDHFLRGKGFIESRRELVGDFLLSSENWSPFSHTLEIGTAWPYGQPSPSLDSVDKATLVSSCVRAVKRAGILSFTLQEPGATPIPVRKRLRESIESLLYNKQRGFVTYLEADTLLLRAIYAIERSIELEIPFYSRDSAAPAWIRESAQSDTHILQLVFDEVDWLPKPLTFKEAFSMAQDERVIGLRAYIRRLSERAGVGDLAQSEDIAEKIRKNVRAFRGKPWASRIAKLVAYAAVPMEVAAMLCHTHFVGISVAGVGAISEWIASIRTRQKKEHWLSMTNVPKYTK